MKKTWLPILFIGLPGILLLVILISLTITRTGIPVHVDATLTRLEFKLAKSEFSDEEITLLEDVDLKGIKFLDFQEIELIGDFSESETSWAIKDIEGLIFTPEGDSAYVKITGESLKLEEVIVKPQTRVNLNPSGDPRLTITGNDDRSGVTMNGPVEVEWQSCNVEITGQGSLGGSSRIFLNPDEGFNWLEVHSRPEQGLKELKLEMELILPEDYVCKLKGELPVDELDFFQKPFAATIPDRASSIQSAEIKLPTLPKEEPIILPAGSYMKVEDLSDFTLKQVSINPYEANIDTVLYGYTSDLKAAYGKGKMTQLLPSSLILLRQKASLLAVIGIMLWFLKNASSVYGRFRSWKKGSGADSFS